MNLPPAFFLALLVAALPCFSRADDLSDTRSKVLVPDLVPLKVHAFPLQDVRLLDGPFKHAMELDQAYLLSLDTDRLLYDFRVNAGIPTAARPLGGWEAPTGELRGHFTGHYLSACALMFASTGDRRFKDRGDAIVAGLAECQAKLGSGFLSAWPETFIDRVEQRVNVWAPYYTLHKIFAGLEDMYVYCDNPQALDVAKKFGDWVITRNSRLTDDQMQAMLQTEQGGMNETLANLYALTGETKYFQMSLRFNHHRVIDPASRQQDRLTGLHANTQIPKFIGTARQFELSYDDTFQTASVFFWNTVVHNRSYVIGGNSDGEGFKSPDTMSQMGPSTTETCNTYNMLKLTRHLFCWEPRVEYADYYERALYNHILASQNPADGMMCYYVPLRSGSRKSDTYSTPLNTFACCTGTGVENHAKYGDSIYFHNDDTLYVNLFIASDLNWEAKGVKLRQTTKFPDESTTKLTFTCEKPVEFAINIRHPSWATENFTFAINGMNSISRIGDHSVAGTWATVKKTWKTGDTIEVSMPFTLRTAAFKDNTNRFAILDGPLVLSARVDNRKPFPVVLADTPALLAALKPIAGQPNTFQASPDLFRIPGDSPTVTLQPFYQIYGTNRYEVYWDRVSSENYAAELAKEQALVARTVDSVTAGEEQNERDHSMRGETTNTRDVNDRTFRSAGVNGWFSWQLKVLPDQPQELQVTFAPGGGRGGNRGAAARSVDIFIDDTKLATEQLTVAARVPATNSQTYPLTPKMLKGKTTITVKFQAAPDAPVGGVSDVRIMKTLPDK